MMEWLLLLAGLVLIQASPLCPAYTCAPLDPGLCASYSNMTVRLNSNACPRGFECSLQSLMSVMTHAYESDFAVVDESEGDISPDTVLSYQCSETGKDPLADSDPEYNACFDRNLERVVASGQFPVPCYYPGFEDTACTMVNGEIGQCLCGLNGQAYCALNEGDPLLHSLFEKCGTSMLHQTRTLWTAFTNHIVQYLTQPDCAPTTITELNDISTGFQSGLLTSTAVDLWRNFDVCPVLSCGKLTYKSCAVVQLNATAVTWTINQQACPLGYVCELAELMLTVNTRIRSGQWGEVEFPCRLEAPNTYVENHHSKVFFNCPNRNMNQTALIPNPSRTCTIPGSTDPACQLKDGSFVPCACGLDGRYYCLGAMADSEFDEMFSLCGREVSESEIYKWETYGKIKPYMAFGLTCRNTFTDLALFTEAEQLPDPPKYTQIDSFFAQNASLVPNAAICPAFTCDTVLPAAICSSWNLTQGFKRPIVRLNPNGCARKETCSLFSLLKQTETAQDGQQTRCLGASSVGVQVTSAFEYPYTAAYSTYAVTGSGRPTLDTATQEALALDIIKIMPTTPTVDRLFPITNQNVTYTMNCPRQRRLSKTLQTGAHPKECSRPGYGDPQCTLQDGSFALCTCGMNGLHYCQVSEGDPEMNALWRICEGTNHTLTFAEARYWYFYVGYFTYLETAPSCSDFYEFDYVVQKRAQVMDLHTEAGSLLHLAALVVLTY